MSEVLRAKSLRRHFRIGTSQVEVLQGVDLSVQRGEWLAILGRSGSGKSTLLHLLGGLDMPDAGEIWFEDQPLSGFSEMKLDRFRNQHVGFVFQFYHLLPELTAIENVLLGEMIRSPLLDWPRTRRRAWQRAADLLERVGLGERMRQRSTKLSGGERQRVAIARALINDPNVLLADEPTGNLDSDTSASIIELIQQLHRDGQTIVMVTHDATVAAHADREQTLVDGKMVESGVGSELGVG